MKVKIYGIVTGIISFAVLSLVPGLFGNCWFAYGVPIAVNNNAWLQYSCYGWPVYGYFVKGLYSTAQWNWLALFVNILTATAIGIFVALLIHLGSTRKGVKGEVVEDKK